MTTPEQIKETVLYQTLSPYIRQKDRDEFARMLSLVPTTTDKLPVFDQKIRLLFAFRWMDTPQGFSYWQKIDRSLSKSGAYEELGI